MTLSEEQKAALGEWVEAGADLGEIQNRLKEEFDLNITYLDTRFLLGDLGLELQSEREEPEPEEESEAEAAPAPPDEPPPGGDAAESGEVEDSPPDTDAPGPDAGNVELTVDALTIPGAVVSGKATFSDGETAAWYLDQMGRLGLDPATPGYQPPPEDVAAFQVELQNVLRKQGF